MMHPAAKSVKHRAFALPEIFSATANKYVTNSKRFKKHGSANSPECPDSQIYLSGCRDLWCKPEDRSIAPGCGISSNLVMGCNRTVPLNGRSPYPVKTC